MNTIKQIRSKEALIAYLAHGGLVKYVYFWGHTPPADGSIDQSCLSQWYDAGFEVDKVHYPTAEHYMMAEKARLFNDNEIYQKILTCSHPHEAKQLGREVKHYDEKMWHAHRLEIVTAGNLAKFSQHDTLKTYLINTGDRILVEASPHDRIWGIGMDRHHPHVALPTQWQGLNLLGFALMEVRHRLST